MITPLIPIILHSLFRIPVSRTYKFSLVCFFESLRLARRSDMHLLVLRFRPHPTFMRKVETIESGKDWGNYYCSFACFAFSSSARRPEVTQKETVEPQRASAPFNNSSLHEPNKEKNPCSCWLTLNISRETRERLLWATRLHGSRVIAIHSPKPWWRSVESYWSCNSRDFGIDRSVRMSKRHHCGT